MRAQPGTVATSNAHGTFRVPGICAGGQANMSAQADGFSVGVAQAQANSSNSAVVTIVLNKLSKYPRGREQEEVEGLGGMCQVARKQKSQGKVTLLLDKAEATAGCPQEKGSQETEGWDRVLTCCCRPPGKPYLVKHPESRVREAGQNVTFCCKAAGTPMPKKYSW